MQIFFVGVSLGLLLTFSSTSTMAFAVGGSPQFNRRSPTSSLLFKHNTGGGAAAAAAGFGITSTGGSSSTTPQMMLPLPMTTKPFSSWLHKRGGGSKAAAAAASTTSSLTKMDPITLLSTCMGYLVIAGSMLFKVPQAVRIFRKKSAEGLSSSMYILETAGIGMSLAFSMKNAFPFSTYGEAVFIVLQNIVIMAGISAYSDTPKPSVLALSLILSGLFFAYAISPAAPMLLVSILQSISIPLLNFSRVPQLILNHKNKSTGELAPSTLILQAAGNLARIFTTIVQVQNNLFLLSCLVAMVFNGALVAQYFMYRGNAVKSS